MNENFQKKMFDYLKKNKIENFIGVPDSTLKDFISRGLEQKKILVTTREEEAIGIASGMSLAKSPSLIFMQNAGFANSLSTITSLVQLYRIPLIFLIGWRGYVPTDAPEHAKIGKIQPALLKLVGIKSRIIKVQNWQKNCDWALKQIKQNKCCALIIRKIPDE